MSGSERVAEAWVPRADDDGSVGFTVNRSQVARLIVGTGVVAVALRFTLSLLFGLKSGTTDPLELLSGCLWALAPMVSVAILLGLPSRGRDRRLGVLLHRDSVEVRNGWFRRPALIPWSSIDRIEVAGGLYRTVRLGGRSLPAPWTFGRWLADPDFDAKVACLRAWWEAARDQPLEHRPPPPVRRTLLALRRR